jgi:WD40 repeat protein/tetratricopeptide (TPR) repeat protein
VSSAAFDPAGQLLATGSGDRVHVHETASGRETRSPLVHPDMVRHVAFSPDGKHLLACYGGPEKSIGGASIWEIASPATQPAHDLVHNDDVFDGAFSPDGRLIVTSSYDKTARVWDAATGAPLALRRFESWVAESAFAADSHSVLSASGREARIWPVPYRGKDGTSLDHKATVLHAALSSDGARVVTCGSDRMARVWDVRSGELVVPPLPHNSDVNWATFSSDGRLLITASADRSARVWDLARGVWPTRSLRHGSNVVHAAFGRDGALAASISRDGILKLWNLSGEAGKPIVLKQGGRGDHLAFDPQGRYLVTIGQDGISQVWDVESGSLAAHPMAGFGKGVPPILFPDEKRFAAEFSPRGSRLLTYSGNEALTWDWKSGRLLRTIRPEQGQSLTYATFSPDGGHILTCTGSGVARVWDALGERDSAFRLEHQGPILFGVFSPDGALVLTTSSDRTGKLWDVATGKLRTSFAHGDRVNHGAFNPDGSLVATASEDHTAAIWSSRTGKLAVPLLYHEEPVLYACFHKSGRLVATGSGGEFLDHKGEARIWDSTTGDPVTLPMRHGTGVRLLEFAGDGQSLLTVAYRDPAARIWSIPRARLPLGDLTAMANLVSGVALDGTGGQTPLPAEELARLERDLRSRHPERFSASKDEVLAWREAEARSTAGLGNWQAALPSYDALLQADPENALFLAGRADSHAGLGHWPEAARDMIQAIDAGSEDVTVWYKAALLCLKGDDSSAYARLRQNLLRRYGDITESEASNALAYLCVLGPSAEQDVGRVVDISRRDVAASPGDYSFHNTLGAALYRAGEFNQSIREFEQAIKLHGKGGGHSDWLFLSMAHRRLGRGDEARRWFLKVDEQAREAQPKEGEIAREWHERVHLEILRGEAEKLLASDGK